MGLESLDVLARATCLLAALALGRTADPAWLIFEIRARLVPAVLGPQGPLLGAAEAAVDEATAPLRARARVVRGPWSARPSSVACP